jgi:hypothetical protein
MMCRDCIRRYLVYWRVAGDNDRYSPAAAIRYSKLPYSQTGRYTNIPLYLAGRTKDFI